MYSNRVVSIIGRANKALAASFSCKLSSRKPSKPMISFSFDDFPRSALVIGGDILLNSGVRGTYYASLGLMGQDSSVGKIFTRDDVGLLIQNGHELACHTFSHISCKPFSSSMVKEDCFTNRDELSRLAQGISLQNFSFPFGDVSLGAKRELSRIYNSCRTVEHGVNRGSIDLAFLRANPLYSRYAPDHIKRLIDETVASNGWTIFYTHDISSSPSQYGCTPQLFQDSVQSAVASGAEVLTVSEAVLRIA